MLIGQSRAEGLLARALARDRVNHAYLFLGPPGAGKATAARILAQALNCAVQPAWEGDLLTPCGECHSCRSIKAGHHPDVRVIRPESKTGQNITVEQSRELRHSASLKPRLGKQRVYYFPNAETLNEEAANALLKTLEEPSPFVTLVLCAPSPSQVLPTIRSRCQTIRFGLAPPGEVEAALRSSGVPDEPARILSRACGGRPGFAVSWARKPAVLERRLCVLDLFAEAIGLQRDARRNPAAGANALRLAEQFRAVAPDPKDRGEEEADEGELEPNRPAKALHSDNLQTGLTLLRDLLLLRQEAPESVLENQDRLAWLRDTIRFMAPAQILAALDASREAQQLLERNVSPQLVLERMFWSLICGPASWQGFETGHSS